MSQYEYGFEIESILKQFTALIDKAIVLRYEKVENERRLVQTIQPMYKFATKSRALLMLLNGAKNFTLPCVVIEVTGIKADKNRLANKQSIISRVDSTNLSEGYKYPTPIEISVTLHIITKYKTDLFQIYGNLASKFQPECFISWIVPTEERVKRVEELRNKVEWDFNLDMDSKETLKEEDEDRFTGKMSFTIQGWLFHNHRDYLGNTILDIGTTELVTNELENRIDGFINTAAPLVSHYGSNYKNPREYATAHIRILKGFTTVHIQNKEYHFRISKDNYNQYKLNSDRDYYMTFDGYNLKKAQALLVPSITPKGRNKINQIEYTYDEFGKVTPKLGESTPKPTTLKGVPVDVVYQTDNTLKIKLPKISYAGDFDVVLYDRIDYDSFSDAEGFLLHATN